MPSLGADMEAGTLVEWLVKPGDRVKRGDVIAVVETQKGAIEIEVFSPGVVSELVVPVGARSYRSELFWRGSTAWRPRRLGLRPRRARLHVPPSPRRLAVEAPPAIRQPLPPRRPPPPRRPRPSCLSASLCRRRRGDARPTKVSISGSSREPVPVVRSRWRMSTPPNPRHRQRTRRDAGPASIPPRCDRPLAPR